MPVGSVDSCCRVALIARSFNVVRWRSGIDWISVLDSSFILRWRSSQWNIGSDAELFCLFTLTETERTLRGWSAYLICGLSKGKLNCVSDHSVNLCDVIRLSHVCYMTIIAAMAHLLCVKCFSYIFIVGQVAAACVSMLAFPPASDQVQTLVWSVLYHTIFSNPFGFVAAYSHWGTRHAVLKWCNHKTSRMLSILLVGVSVISRVRYCWMTSMVPVTSSRSALVIRILIRQVPRLRATMFERRA